MNESPPSAELELLLAHGEGEIGRVAVAGLPPIPGISPAERLAWLNGEGDFLRRFLCSEPRGAAQMSTNLVLPPLLPGADAALFVLQPDRVHAMSGSNAICTATALFETGRIELPPGAPATGPRRLVLETAVGMVPVTGELRADGEGRPVCRSVRLEVSGAEALQLDAPLEVPGLGRLCVDLAFGGVFFVIVRARDLGLRVERGAAGALARSGARVLRAAQAAWPRLSLPGGTEGGIVYALVAGEDEEDGAWVQANVMPPGRLDRSPCGTGTSARLACAALRGEHKPGDRLKVRSIVGSEIRVEYLGRQEKDGAASHSLAITGRGRVYGESRLRLPPGGLEGLRAFVERAEAGEGPRAAEGPQAGHGAERSADGPPEVFTLGDCWGAA